MKTTIERLTLALQEAKAPPAMIEKSKAGAYDDWQSESATPIMDLVQDAERAGLADIARRAKAGEF